MENKHIIKAARKLLGADCDSFFDLGGIGINFTKLAEAVAHELGHDEWLDDSDHVLWSIAAAVCEDFEDHLEEEAEHEAGCS